jgi:hypothetical protein
MVAAIAAVLSGLAISVLFGRSSQAGATSARGAAGPLAKFAAWLDPPVSATAGSMWLPTPLVIAPKDGSSGTWEGESVVTTVLPSAVDDSGSTP